MATLTIELPDELLAELNNRQVSDEFVHLLIAQTMQNSWQNSGTGNQGWFLFPVCGERDCFCWATDWWKPDSFWAAVWLVMPASSSIARLLGQTVGDAELGQGNIYIGGQLTACLPDSIIFLALVIIETLVQKRD